MSGTTRSAAWARRAAIGLATAGLAALLLALGASALADSASPKQPLLDQTAVTSEREARAAYVKLPLSFVPNAGQTDRRVRYSAQAGGASFYFTKRAAVFSFAGKDKGLALRLGFLGANPRVTLGARERGSGRVNNLLGNEPAKWHTNLPTYREVVYRDLWPGIDMVFRGAGGRLKYEFHVAPGASVRDIRLAYSGADGLSLDRSGNLVLRTALGTLEDARPVSYQRIGAKRVPVRSRFLLGAKGGYRFTVADYDRGRPLVIDPGLLYSTYLGGMPNSDRGQGIAVDAAGSAYVTGETQSTNFPTSVGAFDTSRSGGSDAFVTKLNAAGSGLLYSTYLGGGSTDRGSGIVVDPAGSAYVTGTTASTDFPTTVGAFDTSYNGGFTDAFVTRLNAAGSAPLLYSTYLGGSNLDQGGGITVDAGSAYVSGSTGSTNFPTTVGAVDTTYNGGFDDAFVTKLNAAGSAPLLYSTYLGGGSPDRGSGIVVDTAGSAYVTGTTGSTDFPTTVGAFDTSYNGGFTDAFVTKLNAAGSAPLLYSTYLGGGSDDDSFAIALDAAGSAYVTGQTPSTDFPTTAGAFDMTLNNQDAFVTKLNAAGSGLLYSTYLGGSHVDLGFGIAVDPAGSAYVTGFTASTDFPTTVGAFDTSYNGGSGAFPSDAFVTKLNAAGSAPLLYSTYLGGTSNDQGNDIALDAAGSAYVTGVTGSTDFPTTVGAFDTSYNGGFTDAFVTKLDAVGLPATLTLSPTADMNPVGTSHTVTATVEDAGGQPVPNVIVRFTVTGSVNTTGMCTTDGSGQCSFTYQGPELPGGDAITAFADTDNDGMQDVGEPTGAATKAWVLPVSTPLCEVTISNGGRITAANGDRATFGGHAKVSDSGQEVSGQEQYQDHGPAQPLNVHSLNVLAVVCSADRTEATIFGQATIDGSGSFFYRIRVKDLGEPGKGVDMYGILPSNGYASGDQTLQGGNVQITVHE